MRKHKKTVCIKELVEVLDIVFLMNGCNLSEAVHYRYPGTNILDINLVFKNFESAQEDFESNYLDAKELGYAVFVRHGSASIDAWKLLHTVDGVSE